MSERRLRLLWIDAREIVAMNKARDYTLIATEHALPPDAELVSLHVDPRRPDHLAMAVSSAEWPELPPGQILPEHPQVLFWKGRMHPEDVAARNRFVAGCAAAAAAPVTPEIPAPSAPVAGNRRTPQRARRRKASAVGR